MEIPNLLGFVVILRESINLLPRNGKLMACITSIHLLLYSLFFLAFSFASKSLFRDILIKESIIPISTPNSSDFTNAIEGIRKDALLSFFLNFTFIASFVILSFFSTIATIFTSAFSYSDHTLSPTDLLSRIKKSWISLFITWFYTTLLVIGYFFFGLSMSFPLMMSSNIYTSIDRVILFAIFAYIFYLYISVDWVLGLVVSVIEENLCGLEALGKAGKMVKGKKLHGFSMNITFGLMNLVIFQGLRIVKGEKWLFNETAYMLVMVMFSVLFNVFQLVAYTVLYFHCKKNNGEEVELQASVEYGKLTSLPLINATN
nr:uncharacterized protein LOC109153869 [Ipomoea batatas]